MPFELPPLPYPHDALEPWIDARPKRTVFDAPDAPGDPALFPLPQEGRM